MKMSDILNTLSEDVHYEVIPQVIVLTVGMFVYLKSILRLLFDMATLHMKVRMQMTLMDICHFHVM